MGFKGRFRKDKRRRNARRTAIEPLEDRRMFSAEPLGGSIVQHALSAPDFWYDINLERDLEALLGDVEQNLAGAHQLTGVMQARNDYGFYGYGQTVAVIDSGIAWDHPNLGNGFGANARVVGGWDFTDENDANPYDDGPAGSHGTHVAGIVGATANAQGDSGVAPGVDLVGLRVFDDQGAGYFSWVEKALKWVHTNRNAFANPITAVNLSLGTSWNAATVPNWATLEDEFAQLKADGIFIAVSAGNSFSTYKAAGLSYPAASASVVPVMSVDDSGALSYFSQRHSRAIAAPGRSIRSTVPDYVGNQNGKTDDWANYSGTSMASPYVAGASVLVREAMQFVGFTNITEDTIYNQMMSTADSFFDAATNQSYQRLNVQSAIQALMPTDDYGSTSETAHDLGLVSGQQSISGLIGTLSDKDYFTFTAGANGTMTLTVSGTHGLEPNVTLIGGGGTFAEGTTSFEVVAGQSYIISLETAAGHGIGYYDADFTIEESFSQPLMSVKSAVGADGTAFSLDSEGWLSVNGTRMWQATRDFALGADGSLYWHCTNGVLQHRQANGSWETIAYDATKFAVSNTGMVYSLSADGWLRVNGWKAWSRTADFELAGDQTLFWQCTNGVLQQRLSNGVWQTVATDVNRFALRDDGRIYVVEKSEWLNVSGERVWNRTHDFLLMQDQSLYWHCDNGMLQKYAGGCWQTLGTDLTKFAVRQDGSVYSLASNGNVYVDGVLRWTNIGDFHIDAEGHFIVETMGGTAHQIAGRFSVSRARTPTSASVVGQSDVSVEAVDLYSTQSFAAQVLTTLRDEGLTHIRAEAGLDRAFEETHAQLPIGGTFRHFAPAVYVADTLSSERDERALTPTIGDEEEGFRWEHFRSIGAPLDDTAAALVETVNHVAAKSATDALFEEMGG